MEPIFMERNVFPDRSINISKQFDLDYAILNVIINDLAKLNYNVEKVILHSGKAWRPI